MAVGSVHEFIDNTNAKYEIHDARLQGELNSPPVYVENGDLLLQGTLKVGATVDTTQSPAVLTGGTDLETYIQQTATGSSAVNSVNGEQGDVVLTAQDVGAVPLSQFVNISSNIGTDTGQIVIGNFKAVWGKDSVSLNAGVSNVIQNVNLTNYGFSQVSTAFLTVDSETTAQSAVPLVHVVSITTSQLQYHVWRQLGATTTDPRNPKVRWIVIGRVS